MNSRSAVISSPTVDLDSVVVRKLRKAPFRYFMLRHPRIFITGVISVILTDLFDVLTPLGLKSGIDAIENKNAHGLLLSIAAFLGLMVGVTIFRFMWRIYFGRFQHRVAEELRNHLYTKLTQLGPTFFQKRPVGELMSVLINDVTSFQSAAGPGMLILFDGGALIAMILPLMLWLQPSWTWKTLILLPFMPFVVRRMLNLIHSTYEAQQERLADVSANVQEIVSGIRVIKSFAQEDNQSTAFNRLSRAYENACNRVAKEDAKFQPLMDSAVAMGAVILLWYGSSDVVKGTVTLGTFVAFHEYIRRMIWPMAAVGMCASMIEQGRAGLSRVSDLLETETDIPDTGSLTLSKFESLEIRDLTFRYPGTQNEALKDVSMSLRAGETLGIVGPVGAGKSTLLQLLCRMYPVESGKILLNGVDLADYKRSTLSDLISLVPQESFLFSDTVAENLSLGLPIFPGFEAVGEVSAIVNMDHEIEALPEKYRAQLGERGVNLSGGQKQRLTIARAIVRKTAVLMLDDSLSAVDVKTESSIVAALAEARRLNPNQAVILVSHRLATLKHADRILIMNRGAIEASGTHDELLSRSDIYSTLHELQK